MAIWGYRLKDGADPKGPFDNTHVETPADGRITPARSGPIEAMLFEDDVLPDGWVSSPAACAKRGPGRPPKDVSPA